MPEDAPGNPGALPGGLEGGFAGEPEEDAPVLAGRVRGMQARLHRRAGEDSSRRSGDLFSLVGDPYFLAGARSRARPGKGPRTPGTDGVTISRAEHGPGGVSGFLAGIRDQLRAGTYRPQEARQVMIPKKNGTMRKPGIPALAGRVVQASPKLVPEPVSEAGFRPCSYGFRPCRRAQDATAGIRYLSSGTRKYHWAPEAGIRACPDGTGHVPLMGRLRARIKDKRTCALAKAFLKAGVMTRAGDREDSLTGTPQGGILSPLPASIALSALDGHFTAQWEPDNGQRRKRPGNWRLIRYAGDFVIMASGTRRHAGALRAEAAAVLAPPGPRLAEEKTRVAHIGEGLGFPGFTIRRMRKRGTGKHYACTVPSRKAIRAVKDKAAVKTYRATRNQDFAALLQGAGKTPAGRADYFRHGVSKAVFHAIGYYTWGRIMRRLRREHKGRTGLGTPELRRRFRVPGTWISASSGVRFTGASTVPVTRYRYRGANMPTPWTPRPAATVPGG